MKTAAIIPNYLKEKSISFSAELKAYLLNKGYEVLVLGENELPSKKVDFALVLGGDGTLLRAAKRLYGMDIPLLGINFGHLGYLTEATPSDAFSAIDKIISGEYVLENRIMLTGEVIRNNEVIHSFIGLNEASIFRSTLKKAFKLRVNINGMHVQTILGDGLVVATPTGSTSYNLSLGGPVLTPSAENLVLSPISPIYYPNCSLVVNGKDEIEICVSINQPGGIGMASLEIDGDGSFEITDSDVIKIKRAEYTTKTIKVSNRSFYRILKQKLGKSKNEAE